MLDILIITENQQLIIVQRKLHAKNQVINQKPKCHSFKPIF